MANLQQEMFSKIICLNKSSELISRAMEHSIIYILRGHGGLCVC